MGIYEGNVGHSEKGGSTGNEFNPKRTLVLFQLEQSLEYFHFFLFQVWRYLRCRYNSVFVAFRQIQGERLAAFFVVEG